MWSAMSTEFMSLVFAAAGDSEFWSTTQNLVSLGFTGWYAWYVTTRVIPRMQQAANEERTLMQNAYFTERKQLQQQLEQILDRCDRQVSNLVQVMNDQREHSERLVDKLEEKAIDRDTNR